MLGLLFQQAHRIVISQTSVFWLVGIKPDSHCRLCLKKGADVPNSVSKDQSVRHLVSCPADSLHNPLPTEVSDPCLCSDHYAAYLRDATLDRLVIRGRQIIVSAARRVNSDDSDHEVDDFRGPLLFTGCRARSWPQAPTTRLCINTGASSTSPPSRKMSRIRCLPLLEQVSVLNCPGLFDRMTAKKMFFVPTI